MRISIRKAGQIETNVLHENVETRRLASRLIGNVPLIAVVDEPDRHSLISHRDCVPAGEQCEVKPAIRDKVANLHADIVHNVQAAADHIIEVSRRGMQKAILELPDGLYRNEMRIDGYDSRHTCVSPS